MNEKRGSSSDQKPSNDDENLEVAFWAQYDRKPSNDDENLEV